jgi:hypothetical protein
MKIRMIILALTVISAGCGKKAPFQSNLDISDEKAETVLKVRREKTEEIRGHLQALRDGLKPVTTALNDIGNLLGKNTNLDAATALASIFNRLDLILREAGKDIADVKGDGSWSFKRELKLTLPSEVEFGKLACGVNIQGNKLGDKEVASIQLMDCNTKFWTEIASIDISTKDGIDIDLQTDELSKFLNTPFKLHLKDEYETANCRINLIQKNVMVQCKPMSTNVKGMQLAIDDFYFFGNVAKPAARLEPSCCRKTLYRS